MAYHTWEMMEKRYLYKYDLVQIKPDFPKFGSLLLVVTEVKNWIIHGLLLDLRDCRESFRNYEYMIFQINFEFVEYVGKLPFRIHTYVSDDDEPTEDEDSELDNGWKL